MFLQEVHHIFKNALSHDECDHICSIAHAEELKSRSTRWIVNTEEVWYTLMIIK